MGIVVPSEHACYRCEYYSKRANRDHFFDNTIGNGRFDTEYLEALLTGDVDEVSRMELDAETEGYGPRTTCTTVVNNSAQRLTCCMC